MFIDSSIVDITAVYVPVPPTLPQGSGIAGCFPLCSCITSEKPMLLAYASAPAVVSALVVFAGNDVPVSNAFMLQSGIGTTGQQACSNRAGGSQQHSSSYAKNVITARSQLSSCSWTHSQQLLQQEWQPCRQTALPSRLHVQRAIRIPRASRTARSSSVGGTSATTTMSAAAGQIGPGSIVVFESDIRGRPPALGLVTGSGAGKKKSTYLVQPAGSASASGGGKPTLTTVAPRQVRYVVPGGSKYQAEDLSVFEDQQEEVDGALMEEAWDMMLEESTAAATAGLDGSGGGGGGAGTSCTSDDPRGMAELLFGVGEPTPQQCYEAFRLLEGRDGTLYFKRRRDGTYECRSRWVGLAGGVMSGVLVQCFMISYIRILLYIRVRVCGLDFWA